LGVKEGGFMSQHVLFTANTSSVSVIECVGVIHGLIVPAKHINTGKLFC